MFFGRIFGVDRFCSEVSAIAMGNPRDIAFVVDLSGSMNNDTEPCWATYEINNAFRPRAIRTSASEMMQASSTTWLRPFPGTLQWVGAPLGATAESNAYADLTKNNGPLDAGGSPVVYRIINRPRARVTPQDEGLQLDDRQPVAAIMPAAKPTPSSGSYYNYWAKYLDYVIQRKSVTGHGTLPPSQTATASPGSPTPPPIVSRRRYDGDHPLPQQDRVSHVRAVHDGLRPGREARRHRLLATLLDSPDAPITTRPRPAARSASRPARSRRTPSAARLSPPCRWSRTATSVLRT